MDPPNPRSSRKRSRDSPSRRSTPLPTEASGRPSRTPYTQQHTSLPSIRQLHPYLPPSSTMSQHVAGAGGESSYSYPAPQQPGYSGMHHEPSQLNMSPQAQQSDRGDGRGESDADGEDQQGPPKKKRRRQALSCTGAFKPPRSPLLYSPDLTNNYPRTTFPFVPALSILLATRHSVTRSR